MSKFYTDAHRALQDRFDTRRVADLMEGGVAHSQFAEHEIGFIQSRDMFFLSTIDGEGRPTVSHKGGSPGFVKVAGPSTLAFPWYDGNGMYYSAGNLVERPKVGLLFIDFETPNRLRVQGDAAMALDDPLIDSFPGAQFVVRVAVELIWVNCPRYINPRARITQSKYTPRAGEDAPLPAWKRLHIVQDALPERDRRRVKAAGGEITQDDYAQLVSKGEA
jgi:uncharacterized protein